MCDSLLPPPPPPARSCSISVAAAACGTTDTVDLRDVEKKEKLCLPRAPPIHAIFEGKGKKGKRVKQLVCGGKVFVIEDAAEDWTVKH
jgi:hypothetical protein